MLNFFSNDKYLRRKDCSAARAEWKRMLESRIEYVGLLKSGKLERSKGGILIPHSDCGKSPKQLAALNRSAVEAAKRVDELEKVKCQNTNIVWGFIFSFVKSP